MAGELVTSNHGRVNCRRCGTVVRSVQRDGVGAAFFPPCRSCAEPLPSGDPLCPVCETECSPTATVCECGARLAPPVSTAHSTPLAPIPACSCGNDSGDPSQGTCNVCVLASYEPVAR